MTPSPGIKPGTHWWKVSALTTAPTCSSYDELVSRSKVIWASHVFQVGPSVNPHLVKNGDIWLLANKAWSIDCCHGNIIGGIILYLTWCTLLVPSLNGISEIFPEIFLICDLYSYLNYLWCHQLLNKNLNISGMKADLSKKNVPFLLTFKGLSNKQTIFYFMGTLIVLQQECYEVMSSSA